MLVYGLVFFLPPALPMESLGVKDLQLYARCLELRRDIRLLKRANWRSYFLEEGVLILRICTFANRLKAAGQDSLRN